MRRAGFRPITAAGCERLERRALLASVSGHVVSDFDVDGIADPGETGAAGLVVFLDLNNNSDPDPGEPAGATDAAGAYTLDAGAATGALTVRLAASETWGPTAPAGGARTFTITDPQQDVGGVDFLASDRSIFTGRIFEDLDGDGAQGPASRRWPGGSCS